MNNSIYLQGKERIAKILAKEVKDWTLRDEFQACDILDAYVNGQLVELTEKESTRDE